MARKTKAELAAMAKTFAKRTRDRNYRFRKLTKPQQRVRIAKDVIQYLESGKLVAARAGYLNVPDAYEKYFSSGEVMADLEYELEEAENGDMSDDSYTDTQSQAEMKQVSKELNTQMKLSLTPLHEVFEKTPSCTVCGIGAAFVAAVLRADDTVVGDLDGREDAMQMRHYLGTWFDLPQLGMIEAAFEQQGSFAKAQGSSIISAHRSWQFGEAIYDPEDRMIAIMKNIVDNNGTFVP